MLGIETEPESRRVVGRQHRPPAIQTQNLAGAQPRGGLGPVPPPADS